MISHKMTTVATQTIARTAPAFLMSEPVANVSQLRSADLSKSSLQWENLCSTLEKVGANVQLYSQTTKSTVSKVPEVGISAVVRNGTAYIPNSKNIRGIVRRSLMENWAEKAAGLQKKYLDSKTNMRDIVKINDNFFLANKSCSDSLSEKEIGAKIQFVDVKPVSFKLSCLDTVFCPLTERTALIVEEAFSEEDIHLLREHFNLISVSICDAENLACKSIVVGNCVVLPRSCIQTYTKLAMHGFQPVPIPASALTLGLQSYALRFM